MKRSLALASMLIAIFAIGCSSSEADPTESPASPTATLVASPVASPTALPDCSFASATSTVFGSVVQVVTDGGSGTAFAIGDGEFLTAAHVVIDATEISLHTSSAEAPAEIVGIEEDTDIAIIRSNIDGIEAVDFGSVDLLAPGQGVAVAGYPAFVEYDPSVVSGLLSKIVEDPALGFGTFLQTDAAVNPGNSGGPMFNECGQVIGMVVRKVVDTSIEGISWAVAENTLQSALPRVRRKGVPEQENVAIEYVEVDAVERSITATGGRGVLLRDDCLDGATIEGAWPDGMVVTVWYDGVGFCEGWSVAVTEDAYSWVRDRYLADASSPSVQQPPQNQPSSGSTITEAIDFLLDASDEYFRIDDAFFAILDDVNDDVIDSDTAVRRLFDLETEAYDYADMIFSPTRNFEAVSANCEQARQAFGDAILLAGASAGFAAEYISGGPDDSLDESLNASDRSEETRQEGLDYLKVCLAEE